MEKLEENKRRGRNLDEGESETVNTTYVKE
jgi:hypothetical protein